MTIDILVTALGAGLGSVLRWWVLVQLDRRRLPGGVAWVNIPAAVAAGAVVGAGCPQSVSLVVVGVCGGLSTYSSLALELAVALRDRDHRGVAMSASGLALGLAAGVAAFTGFGSLGR